MNAPRGKPFQKGNKAAPGGARKVVGRRALNGRGGTLRALKAVLNDLLAEALDSDEKRRTALRLAWDLTVATMTEEDEDGLTTNAAVRSRELVLAYGFGKPTERVEHSGAVDVIKVIEREAKPS